MPTFANLGFIVGGSSQAVPLPATAMAWTVFQCSSLVGCQPVAALVGSCANAVVRCHVQSFVLQRCQQKLSLQQRVHVFASVHYQDSEAIVLQWRSQATYPQKRHKLASCRH